MTVASRTMAMPVPMPNSWIKLTWAVPKAKNVMASRAAAVVTMRPVRPSPVATDSTVSAPASCASLMRASRNTS